MCVDNDVKVEPVWYDDNKQLYIATWLYITTVSWPTPISDSGHQARMAVQVPILRCCLIEELYKSTGELVSPRMLVVFYNCWKVLDQS